MGLCHLKESLRIDPRMDVVIRVLKPTEKTWNLRLEKKEQGHQLFVQRTDNSGGWSKAFFVTIQNHLGEYQQIEISKCETNILIMPVNLYIQLRHKPERQFWKIPALIFQTWKDGPKTEEMTKAIKSFQDQPGYTHICWNDVECRNFLFNIYGERYAKAYVSLVPGAYRADFWRYCMLYKFGGIYVDAKTSCLRPLDEIIRPDDELIVVRDLPKSCLLNGFIACRPGHPLLEIVIERVLQNIENRSYGSSPLDITGPHIFAKAFCQWKGFPDDTMALFAGYTQTTQMLARDEDKVHIISPEGEQLFVKEYASYYKNDVDVSTHYPQLWASRAVYSDQPPWKK
jgi:hypothetical protein